MKTKTKKAKAKLGRPPGKVKNEKPGEFHRLYMLNRVNFEKLSSETNLSKFTLYNALKGLATEKTRTTIANALGFDVAKF